MFFSCRAPLLILLCSILPALAVRPPNDNFSQAAVIDSFPFVFEGDLRGATYEIEELVPLLAVSPGSLWWVFRPEQTGELRVTIQTDPNDLIDTWPVLYAYEGESITDLRDVGFGHLMTGGKTYYLQLTSMEPFHNEAFVLEAGFIPLVIAPQPVNDDFADAIVPSGKIYLFNTGATLEPGEFNNPDLAANAGKGTVWFKWTSDEVADVRLSLANSTVDTMAGLFLGDNVSNLVTIIPPQSEDTFGLPIAHAGALAFRAQKDVVYRIAVMGHPNSENAEGLVAGLFSVTRKPWLDNDMFIDRTLLEGRDISIEGANWDGTVEEGEPGDSSMWYSWTAPAAGVASVSVTSSTGHQVVVFRGDSPETFTELQGPVGDLNVTVESGDQLYIAVHTSGNPNARDGSYTLSIRLTSSSPPSPNDDFADALRIAGLPYSNYGNLHGATMESGEPMSGEPIAAQSLWWIFAAEESGGLSLSAEAELWIPSLQAYEGTSLNSLTPIWLRGGSTIEIFVRAGAVYAVQLTPQAPFVGHDFALHASFSTHALANDAFADSIQLRGWPHDVGGWLVDGTIEPNEPWPEGLRFETFWWSWMAPEDGRLIVQPEWIVHPSEPDYSSVKIYTGPEVDQLTVASARRTLGQDIILAVKAGETYHLQLGAIHPEPERGGFHLDFVPLRPAPSDDFADAADFADSIKSNLGATREDGEPDHGVDGPSKSIWWRWQAPINHRAEMRIGSAGTITNAMLAVYQGDSIGSLRLIAQGAGVVTFGAYATDVYYIAVTTPIDLDGDIEIRRGSGFPMQTTRSIPDNLVRNPSFEESGGHLFLEWEGDYGGRFSENTCADGVNHALVSSSAIWQDIETTPGLEYRLRFAYGADLSAMNFNVLLNNQSLTHVSNPLASGWTAAELFFTATEPISRLEFLNQGPTLKLDQVSVVSMADAPVIINHPENQTVFQGRDVTFQSDIAGLEPLTRQWFFNGDPIAGATDTLLPLHAVSLADAGDYHLEVTNDFGSAVSHAAVLQVLLPPSLKILFQPQGGRILPGQRVVLHAAAEGEPPLQYEWHRNHVVIGAASGPTLVIDEFSPSDAGEYQVRVSSGGESVTSLPAVLGLDEIPAAGGGVIYFANSLLGGSDLAAPVFDLDGATRLFGSDFVAQLYAGVDPNMLQPIGIPQSFHSGMGDGIWIPAEIVLPMIEPGQVFYAQARVWDQAIGPTYEIARALGGKIGRSRLLELVAGDPLGFPPSMEGLRSFQLVQPYAGSSSFSAGRFDFVQRQDNLLIWTFTGAPGFHFLIERQTDGLQWMPLSTHFNESGTFTFEDGVAKAPVKQLYRARILD